MAEGWVACVRCSKVFLRDNRHINENKKLSHNFYCSIQCQSLYKNKQKEFICENPGCKIIFKRSPNDISLHNFCSRSCAASINNTKFPKRLSLKKKCNSCGNHFVSKRKYCSLECKHKALIIDKDEIIIKIRKFNNKFGRVPLKREFKHVIVARKRFGSWNKAIEAAGFKPNPVMFAKHHIAQDGHVCDSLAEKIIDDWLYDKKIIHERNIPYPEGRLTADFKIGDKIVEYFGLAGEHERYDELKRLKMEIANKYGLNLVQVYPENLYSKEGLEKILVF